MAELFNQWGNFLFHTRNVLFPVLVAIVFFLWSPVAFDASPGFYFMLIGLLLITLGQGLRILTIGLSYIVRGGRNRRIYAENLVTDGLFAHSRNPLYVGNVLIAFGFFFVSGNLLGMIVGCLLFLAIYRLIIHSEETFLRGKFGAPYDEFCKDVPRWLPNFKGLSETMSQYDFDWPAVAVKEYGTILSSTLVPLGLIAWKLNLSHQLANYQGLLIGLTIIILAAYGVVRFLKKTERLRSMR